MKKNKKFNVGTFHDVQALNYIIKKKCDGSLTPYFVKKFKLFPWPSFLRELSSKLNRIIK